MITISNVTFGYTTGQPIFQDLSLKLDSCSNQGNIIAVTGANASGKSTLLKLVAGIIQPNVGQLVFHTGITCGYVPQTPTLFDYLSPWENARFMKRVRAQAASYSEAYVNTICCKLGLEDVLAKTHSVSELSGGQKQKVALVRALSTKPRVLLLDEPAASLDAQVRQRFLLELASLCHAERLLILMVTHQAAEIRHIAGSVVFIDRPSGDQPAKVLLGDTTNMFEQPPTLDAVFAFSDTLLNRIDVMLSKAQIYSDGGGVLGHLVTNGVVDGRYVLLVPPKSLSFDEEPGISFTQITSSSGATHVRATDLSTQPIVCSGNRTGGDYLRLRGKVFLLENESSAAVPVMVE